MPISTEGSVLADFTAVDRAAPAAMAGAPPPITASVATPSRISLGAVGFTSSTVSAAHRPGAAPGQTDRDGLRGYRVAWLRPARTAGSHLRYCWLPGAANVQTCWLALRSVKPGDGCAAGADTPLMACAVVP
jgi:hypothetical protein